MGKIYTKTGDKGDTGTFLGRMSKSDCQTEALGSIDELNSWIGVCRSEINSKFKTEGPKNIRNLKSGDQLLERELKKVQGNLLTIGALLAGSQKKKFTGSATMRLEALIDKLDKDLPELTNFIYPTGVELAAYLQMARAIARRVERNVVAWILSRERAVAGSESILKYLNRLSDTLFVMGRWINMRLGGKDEIWK